MAKVSTNINLDAKLKKESQELFADLGMDLTTAVTIFLRQSVREQGLPFKVSRDLEIPNKVTIEAIKECEEIAKCPDNYKHYKSFKEALKDINND